MLLPLDLPNADLTWPVHCVPGTQGFELLDGLPAPIDYDFFVWKGVEPDLHPYGTCFHDLAERRSTGLIEFLHARGVSTVLVGGLATDYCVKTSVLQLRHAGFRVIVHLDACRGIAPETVASAHTQMIEAGAELAQTLIDVQRLLDA
jgi:nicotinamidase/pyrazinamidase